MLSVRGGGKGGHNFLSLFYVSTNFKRIFFEKNRRTLFGSLKCRQTLFNAQILFYKDFYDFFRFTLPSSIVNAFPSFAIHLREANWRPTLGWVIFRKSSPIKVCILWGNLDIYRVHLNQKESAPYFIKFLAPGLFIHCTESTTLPFGTNFKLRISINFTNKFTYCYLKGAIHM